MSEQINPRSLVLDILLAVERDGEFSHIAVRQMLDKYRYLPHRTVLLSSGSARGPLSGRSSWIISSASFQKSG